MRLWVWAAGWVSALAVAGGVARAQDRPGDLPAHTPAAPQSVQPDARQRSDGADAWRFHERFAPAIENAEPWCRPTRGAYATLDLSDFSALVHQAPLERVGEKQHGRVIALPMPEGHLEHFAIIEAPVMAPELAAKFPGWRTYVGQGIETPGATLRLDLTERGLAAQILSERGVIYIDPYSRGDDRHYVSYFSHHYPRTRPFACATDGEPEDGADPHPSTRSGTPRCGDTRRVYRLAVAATGEYTALQGGPTGAMNAIVTLVNRLNGVYEVEANIRFVLVADNADIIYTNAGSDPYDNSNNNDMLGQNQIAIDLEIGSSNYDIGHVFGTANGGVASIGVVCMSGQKARGVSASPFAVTDPYTVQTFCHEVGHQFSARHTFNGVNGSCTPGQRFASEAYEPGSGSTLMSYASFCGSDNVIATYGELYLNAQSFGRINNYANGMGACATTQATGNSAPSVDGGTDFTIPAFTPFILSATGSDPDLDSVTFCWEQRDLGPAQPLTAGDTGVGPIIRSRPPTSSSARSIPILSAVLGNTQPAGEIVPTTTRTLNFRVTARDNRAGAGGVSTDDVSLQVEGTAGPFRITSPNTSVSWSPGSQTVTWDVAGTDIAPISCATVRVLYSSDGGLNFAVLATGVPNTGSTSVTIPAGGTSQARIRIEAEGNIFYDVSDVNFTLPCEPPAGVLASEAFCDRVDVSWNAVVGATGYSVWRGTTNSPGSASLVGSSPTTSLQDTTGVSGTTYHYFVSSVAASCTSGLSTPDQGQRVPLTALGAVTPTSSCSSIDLSWSAYAGATGYQVRRNTSNSLIGATLVASPAMPSHSDTTATPGVHYYYFVRAQTASCGFSPYAPVAEGTRLSTPTVPDGVAASDLSSCENVIVSWNTSAGATSYEVLRSTVNDAQTAVSLGNTAASPFNDATALGGVPYFYFVRGKNSCGASAPGTGDQGTRTQAIAITSEPEPVSVCEGEDAVFSVAASGSAPITYQWFVAGAPAGTNAPALTLENVTLAQDAATVSVDVSNACGLVSSTVVALDVRVCGPELFVDGSAAAGGNGSSWTLAFQTLRDALAYAAAEPGVTTIRVAAGTHTPHASDRSVSFVPRDGLTIIGGYPAGGGAEETRDPGVNVVILSGDLAGDDAASFGARADNARRVVAVAAGEVTLDGVTIRGGNADEAEGANSGAGLYVAAGAEASLLRSIVADNESILLGGGVHGLGSLTIRESTVVANRSLQGGGLAIAGAADVVNSTISANTASSATAGEGGGGILLLAPGEARLRHATVAFNGAGGAGGGLLHEGGALETDYSLFSGNSAPTGPDVSGDLGSLGFNLVHDDAGATGLTASDIVGADPRLQPLASNGGPTPTHALGLYSIAIDAAPTCVEPLDQRGETRPIAGIASGDDFCDIGALEAETQPALCPADLDDGSWTGYPEGGVDINDLLYFLIEFEAGTENSDLDDGSATGTPDGGVDVNDLLYFLIHFEGGC